MIKLFLDKLERYVDSATFNSIVWSKSWGRFIKVANFLDWYVFAYLRFIPEFIDRELEHFHDPHFRYIPVFICVSLSVMLLQIFKVGMFANYCLFFNFRVSCLICCFIYFKGWY